ncbi:MAG: D-glycerate dehydrogenase [Silvanigrellales bacterium]|nr:D-glycerate dehydrogenase [Silvanigrellales bacterium]
MKLANPSLLPSLSLSTERFPGLLDEARTTLVTKDFEHVILEVAPGPGAVERFLAWARANHENTPHVKALHVGIADPIDAEGFALLREAFPEAGLLTNFGVGLNHLDLEAATRACFRVTNTPGVLTDATADTALLLLLLVTRDAAPALASLREQGCYEGWKPVARFMGQSVATKTLGLAGYGRIARAFAARAEALGMHVVVMESARRRAGTARPFSEGNGSDPVRLPEQEFLASCDVLSLHFPLAPETRGWLSAERLGQLKQGAFVLNTSRGEVVDESALSDALQAGRLAGAGLDVFQGEPVLSEPLRRAPRLVVLPHMGSATWQTRRAMGRLCKDALVAYLAKPLPE